MFPRFVFVSLRYDCVVIIFNREHRRRSPFDRTTLKRALHLHRSIPRPKSIYEVKTLVLHICMRKQIDVMRRDLTQNLSVCSQIENEFHYSKEWFVYDMI